MIRAARVHISVPASSSFRQMAEPSASVQVTPAGTALGEEQANALRFLVASAVPGLRPEAVSVIDASTGVVLTAETQMPSLSADARRAESLRRGVERLLSARVGPGNAVVEVSLETVTDRESIVERQVDPSTRVAISSETEERSASSEGQTGAVTVASNLPDGDAGGADSSSQNSETREIVNYEVSQTEREILREPGAIRRLTVAVLVDGTRTIDANGAEVFAARSDEELADLRELVASAVGFDESRGDQITIKSLEFEPTAFDGSGPTPERFGQIDIMSLIRIGILALVALVLGIFVVRPILANRALPTPDRSLPPPVDGAPAGLPAVVETVGPALDGEIQTGDFAGPAMTTVGNYGFDDALAPLDALGGDGDPVARLKRLIAERQDETIEILRSWMEDEREKT
jgi:flagellar M-ring protein FliF